MSIHEKIFDFVSLRTVFFFALKFEIYKGKYEHLLTTLKWLNVYFDVQCMQL